LQIVLPRRVGQSPSMVRLLSMTMKHRWLGNQSPPSGPLFWRALDRLDYWLTQVRLWVGGTQSRKRTDWPPQRDCERILMMIVGGSSGASRV
jgi:hypothetical protein